jgi:hypothetical protein
MDRLARFRQALVPHLGHTLTPELCAALEHAAFATPDERIDPGQFGINRCGSYAFAVESFAEVLPELHALHEAHFAETERYRGHLAMNPDYEVMKAEERAGTMVQITARQAGELVGHIRLYIRRGRHTQTLHALEDAMYLLPEARGGRTALRMVQYSERVLKALGVAEVRCSAKLSNGAARFLEGAGYKPVATELVKFLET